MSVVEGLGIFIALMFISASPDLIEFIADKVQRFFSDKK